MKLATFFSPKASVIVIIVNSLLQNFLKQGLSSCAEISHSSLLGDTPPAVAVIIT